LGFLKKNNQKIRILFLSIFILSIRSPSEKVFYSALVGHQTQALLKNSSMSVSDLFSGQKRDFVFRIRQILKGIFN
jgi:hypothetical protein